MKDHDYWWLVPPADLTLSKDEVHVWRISFNMLAHYFIRLQHILTVDELERGRRFYFEKDRLHFIIGRGVLRTILGRYLNIDPDRIRFCYNDFGKPALVSTFDQENINFNLSHSHGLALYAFTRGRTVGIDLEYIRVDFEYEQIAERFFSLQEKAILHGLPVEIKGKAFFDCWTRKEAYIKARGEGLTLPLDQFDVSLAPSEPARLLSIKGNPQEADNWSLQELSPDPDYVAALVVQGHGWQLKSWQWS